jgi:hypothetical protein
MRTHVALMLATAVALHAVAPSRTDANAAEGQEDRESVSSVGAILALDAAIQKRFEKVDGRFGYTRLMLPNGAHGFAPENDEEIPSLRELEDANLRVALYLASRRFVATTPDEKQVRASQRIKGPLLISTGDNWPTSAPSDLRVGDVLGVVFYAYQPRLALRPQF